MHSAFMAEPMIDFTSRLEGDAVKEPEMIMRSWFFSVVCIALLAGCQRGEPQVKYSTTDGRAFRAGQSYKFVGDGMFEPLADQSVIGVEGLRTPGTPESGLVLAPNPPSTELAQRLP